MKYQQLLHQAADFQLRQELQGSSWVHGAGELEQAVRATRQLLSVIMRKFFIVIPMISPRFEYRIG